MGQFNSMPTVRDQLFNDFQRCITSNVFELIAAGDMRFFIHEDILTFQSQPFRETADKILKDGSERKIYLADWDAETVARLVQFLYTGDYQYPDPVSILDESLGSPTPTKLLSDEKRLDSFDPATYDYLDTLLSHARLHILAGDKSINALQTLAEHRFSQTLSTMSPFTPDSKHLLLGFVELVRYIYAKTVCGNGPEGTLRGYLCLFILQNLTSWQAEPAAVQLMAKGGDLVTDVMTGVSEMLKDGTLVPQESARKRYISKLLVVSGIPGQKPPPGCVQEVQGTDASLNYPFSSPYVNFIPLIGRWKKRSKCRRWVSGGKRVKHKVEVVLNPSNSQIFMNRIWLVPEYTNNIQDACTGFRVPKIHQDLSGPDVSGEGDKPAGFLIAVKEPLSKKKVIDVALVRSDSQGLELGEIKRYDGMSSNLGRPCSGLYLLWKLF